MADEPYGVLDEAMLRPPQIAGCERIPFLVMLGAVAFVTVTGFGLTLPGAIGGILLVAAGIMLLRRIAAHDPFWFAILFEAATYPRRMPDVLPDRTIPQDLAFVGYADPPSPGRRGPAPDRGGRRRSRAGRSGLAALRPRARALHAGRTCRGRGHRHRPQHAEVRQAQGRVTFRTGCRRRAPE